MNELKNILKIIHIRNQTIQFKILAKLDGQFLFKMSVHSLKYLKYPPSARHNRTIVVGRHRNRLEIIENHKV